MLNFHVGAAHVPAHDSLSLFVATIIRQRIFFVAVTSFASAKERSYIVLGVIYNQSSVYFCPFISYSILYI
jgi:hypothetical protein